MLSRGENGQFQWEPTGAREVTEFVKGLGEAESGNLPLTYELKQKLDQALKTLAPRGGVDAMADANRRLYSSLKHALGKVPGAVDIILPVHNAIHITRRCIQRVLDRTQWPFHLYIVDDASDPFTHAELERLTEANKSCVTLITNLRNKGFAATVNRGIREGKGEYVCLLNSDVFVTDLWLSKMMLALLSEPRNKIVCPVTNNTAIVDVPMSPGASYLQMNQILESFAQRRYPELMPTGFCFMFPREMISKIGSFDESYQNFGEESLALDTPILTPKGWTNVDQINEGDFVYAIDGTPTRVVKTTEIFRDRECYQVYFQDHTSVVCDAGHKWQDPRGDVLTTVEIRAQLALGERFYVTLPGAIRYPKQNKLPIDPYVLGAWLGDGHSQGARITCMDEPILEEIRRAGWTITQQRSLITYSITPGVPPMHRGAGGQFTHSNGVSLVSKLRCLNLVNNKHIPLEYMTASVEDRIALTQGLMDTDGYCAPAGSCTFSSSKIWIAEDFALLVRSLGCRASVTAAQKGNYKVTFRGMGFVPFRLARKADRCRPSSRQTGPWMRIDKVEPVASVPVKCIGVAHRSHQFLAGRSLKSTHNTDWWWKTIRYAEGDQYQRYRAVLADDAYVFHERGTSYSQLGNDTHMHYRKLASSRFNKLWPEWVTWKNTYDVSKTMGGLREKIPATLLRGPKDRYRVCWVVHDAKGSCGGMKYIADVVNEMIEQGINAKVAVIKRREEQPEVYLGELCTAPIFFNSREEFIKDFPTRVFPGGILIGATSELSPVIQLVGEMSEGRVRPLLHAQSYEPEICADPNDREVAKSLFTRVPDIISNAKWVTKAIKADANMQPLATIHPGVDTFLFYRRDRAQGDERPTVLLPMNPHYPCKGFNRGLELIAALEFLATQLKLDIRILVYGCESLPVITQAICQGDIPQMRVATLLGTEVDAFIDPSLLHSYGMPSLEAAASGVKVFSWDNKGIKEYAEGIAAEVYPNDLRPLDVARAIIDYLANPDAQREHQEKYTATRAHITKYHNREESVQTFIKQVEKHFNLNFVSRRICMLVPHLRKHGGPTTMLHLANELQAAGHKVGITTVYADVSPEVVGMTSLPVNVNAQKIPPCDLVITNSDNPMAEAVSKLDKVKKIMLKLSHNPRFKKEEEKGLQQKWDAIVTSTDWLVDACKNPTEGWEYLSCDAERIGWWNYAFGLFQCAPDSRAYGVGTTESPVTIGTLIHAHPSKGSREAIDALGALTLKYGPHVRFIGVGEVPPQAFRSNLPNFEYRFQLSREQMAKTMREMDIWIGASHSEGLGRMGLEAMSSSAAVISTNTSAEYMQDGVNCLLVPIGDSRALAAAVSRLMEQPELAQMIRMRGFETAASLADPAPTIGALQKVIARVFAQ